MPHFFRELFRGKRCENRPEDKSAVRETDHYADEESQKLKEDMERRMQEMAALAGGLKGEARQQYQVFREEYEKKREAQSRKRQTLSSKLDEMNQIIEKHEGGIHKSATLEWKKQQFLSEAGNLEALSKEKRAAWLESAKGGVAPDPESSRKALEEYRFALKHEYDHWRLKVGDFQEKRPILQEEYDAKIAALKQEGEMALRARQEVDARIAKEREIAELRKTNAEHVGFIQENVRPQFQGERGPYGGEPVPGVARMEKIPVQPADGSPSAGRLPEAQRGSQPGAPAVRRNAGREDLPGAGVPGTNATERTMRERAAAIPEAKVVAPDVAGDLLTGLRSSLDAYKAGGEKGEVRTAMLKAEQFFSEDVRAIPNMAGNQLIVSGQRRWDLLPEERKEEYNRLRAEAIQIMRGTP